MLCQKTDAVSGIVDRDERLLAGHAGFLDPGERLAQIGQQGRVDGQLRGGVDVHDVARLLIRGTRARRVRVRHEQIRLDVVLLAGRHVYLLRIAAQRLQIIGIQGNHKRNTTRHTDLARWSCAALQ